MELVPIRGNQHNIDSVRRTVSRRLPRPGFYSLVQLVLLLSLFALPAAGQKTPFAPIQSPEWVRSVTRMAFITPGEVEATAKMGVQAVHFNLVWPYYPLRRDGGGLAPAEAKQLRDFVEACHKHGMKAVLGLPPFPSVANVKAHPDWRIHPDDTGAILKVEPKEENLGTRIGCNVGPWGDYLIELCGELVEDYHLDGFSFDGNYHPPLCYCPACKRAYQQDTGQNLPPKLNLDDIAYRLYLVWRGERLEDHIRRLQARIKKTNPDAVLISWSVNAGRYGHFLTSPRSMTTRMNLLLDMPMQEWWLDETNLGGSIAPAFGAAYLRAVAGDRPNASEAYMMSRGNPYGTHSYPRHEQIARVLLAITNGSILAEALGWPDHRETAVEAFTEVGKRAKWLTNTKRMPWAALLVSEQTRQFVAYRDIAATYLPHLFGAFRAATEEHLAVDLINDWDVTPERLAKYRVLLLPNAAALSDAQVEAIRAYVRNGGGLVATGETSLCDELGRPRRDFALADLFGVSYRGRPQTSAVRPELDSNFAVTVDENYWRQRVGVADLTWTDHPLTRDARLNALVPRKTVIFRGPLVAVTEPKEAGDVVGRFTPEGGKVALPALIVRQVGKGRVVYLTSAVDAALWSYAFPYQRRLLARALEWAADKPFAISVEAPMCAQTTFFEQSDQDGRRVVVHLYNGMNSAGGHGLPVMEVPLREETVPLHGIRVRFEGLAIKRFHIEPGGITPPTRREGHTLIVEVPPLALHAMLVAEL